MSVSERIVHVTDEDVFHDGDEVGVDLGVARYMLFVKMAQVGGDDVHRVSFVAGAQADDRYRQGFRPGPDTTVHPLLAHVRESPRLDP